MNKPLVGREIRRLQILDNMEASAEAALAKARRTKIRYVVSLVDRGISQAEVARALGITRATLNQKVIAARAGRKQGKQG